LLKKVRDVLCSAGFQQAWIELKTVAGWKPALRKPSKGFFNSLLNPLWQATLSTNPPSERKQRACSPSPGGTLSAHGKINFPECKEKKFKTCERWKPGPR